jgi:hypothetical protein
MKAIRRKEKMEVRKELQNLSLFRCFWYVTLCSFMSVWCNRIGMFIFIVIFTLPLTLPIYFGYCSAKFGYGSPLSILFWMIIVLITQYTSWHITDYFFFTEKDWEEMEDYKFIVPYMRYLYRLKKQGIVISVDMEDDFPETI